MADDLSKYGTVTDINDLSRYGTIKEQPIPRELSTSEKLRNVLMRGTTEGPGQYPTWAADHQFEFPPWLQKTGTAIVVAEGLPALVKAAPAIVRGFPAAAGTVAKALVSPRATAKRFAEGVEPFLEDTGSWPIPPWKPNVQPGTYTPPVAKPRTPTRPVPQAPPAPPQSVFQRELPAPGERIQKPELNVRTTAIAREPEAAVVAQRSVLDDIAKGMGERSYARATPERKAVIDKLAAKIHAQGIPAPTPAAAAPQTRPAASPAPSTEPLPAPRPQALAEPAGGLNVQGSTEAVKNRVAGRANMMEVHAVNKYRHLVDELVKSKGMTQAEFAAKPLKDQVDVLNEAIGNVMEKGKAGDLRFRNATGKYGKFRLDQGYAGETKAAMEAIKEMLPKTPGEYISPYGLTPPRTSPQ